VKGDGQKYQTSFAKRLQSIIKSFPRDTGATQNLRPPPGTYTRSNPTPRSALNNNQVSNQQPGDSSSSPSLHHRPSGSKGNTFNKSITQHRVLFLAKQGKDHKLTQICVSDLGCHTVSETLKEEYFRLRGVLRGRFSVWRYSHCDFYKVNAPV
jgi:hypothetical protein